ncbi:MAG: hypothetical protein ABFS56_24350 [Pseudomonadota bacterium]
MDQNRQKAVEYYRKAAEQGFAPAQVQGLAGATRLA